MSSTRAHALSHTHEAEQEQEQEHHPSDIHPGHGHAYEHSKRQACPQGKAYYVCAVGSFKGCCSSDPCSSGLCGDYPHDPAWKPSLATATASVTETQVTIGSYTTTVTLSLTHVPATSTLAGSGETGSAGDASSTSEVSALTLASTEVSTLSISHTSGITHISSSSPSAISHKTSVTHSSSSSPFLSIPLATSNANSHSTSTQGGTVAGITVGLAGGIALLILLCCICVRRRRKTVVEDKELKQALKEAAAVQAERNKALRALENRRTGVGGEGAWAASPGFRTKFSGVLGR